MSVFPESEWETLALEWLADLEWKPTHGSEVAPGTEDGRTSWDDIVLPERLLRKMRELNPVVPHEYLVQARAAWTCRRTRPGHRRHG